MAGLEHAAVRVLDAPRGRATINGREVTLNYDDVTDDFADVMQMKVIRGRWFNAEDDASTVSAGGPRRGRRRGDLRRRRSDRPEDRRRRDHDAAASSASSRRIARTAKSAGPDEHDVPPHRRRTAKYGRLGSHLLVRVHPGTPAGFRREARARGWSRSRRTSRSACGTWSRCARTCCARGSRRSSPAAIVGAVPHLDGRSRADRRALAERDPPHARDRPAPRHGRLRPERAPPDPARGGAARDDRRRSPAASSSCSSRSSARSRSSRRRRSRSASSARLRRFTRSRYFAACTRAGSRRDCNRRTRCGMSR